MKIGRKAEKAMRELGWLQITLVWDDEVPDNKGWFVKTSLEGCMTQGDDLNDALKMVQDALGGWVHIVAVEDHLDMQQYCVPNLTRKEVMDAIARK